MTTETTKYGNVTVRRYYRDGVLLRADIFNASGWRDTIVKTERGIRNAVARLNAHDCDENAVPYASDGALGHGWECGICGAFLQAG